MSTREQLFTGAANLRATTLISGPPGAEQKINLQKALEDPAFEWESLKGPFTFELTQEQYHEIVEKSKAAGEPGPLVKGQIYWTFEQHGNVVIEPLQVYLGAPTDIAIKRETGSSVPAFWCRSGPRQLCQLNADNTCSCVQCATQCIAIDGVEGWYCNCELMQACVEC